MGVLKYGVRGVLTQFGLLLKDNKPLLSTNKKSQPDVYSVDTKKYHPYQDGRQYSFDSRGYWSLFFDSMIFIDPIRHYERAGRSSNPYYFEGDKLITELDDLNRNTPLEYREFHRKLKAWLEKIMDEQIDFDINKKLNFFFERDKKEINSQLNSLGTGISQIFMLLAYLWLQKDKYLNVFLEEPENNLHPEALITLTKIFEEEFPKHTFFITTHSPALIDRVNENWSIHHVRRIKDSPSKYTPCNKVVEYFELLNDLGFRASQLVQSNIVIWVEGPSDRIYIKKWIDLLSQRELIENKHYSFIMYGGSNLDGYNLFENDNNIGILKTSRYAVIICDSDKREQKSKLKKRVLNIAKEILGEDLKMNFEGGKSSDYAYLWISEGREIENYIPSSLMAETLNIDGIKKVRFNRTKTSDKVVNLIYKNEEAKKSICPIYEAFDVHFPKFYCGENDEDIDLSLIGTHFNQKKVEIAKAVCKDWTDKHFEANLRERIHELISFIKLANNIK